ncbi:MAG: homoserine kinase [Syntrophaceticus sp.]|jgi:homoserine kinase
MGKKIVVNVPASTANLGPGFDALGMALDLYNTVALEKMDNGCHIVEVKGEGESSLPRDNCNLVARAVSFLMQRAGYSEHGFKLSLDNQIPLMSGLGSSAAAIVGGLVAANALLGKPFTDRDVLQMAVEIEGHPDNVAAALLGGVVIVAKDGESYIYSRFTPKKGIKITAVIPEFSVSTNKARSVLPENVPLQDAVYNLGRTALLVTALREGDWELLKVALQDRLHQPYRCSLVPGMNEAFQAALDSGAYGVFLSGAGPTVITFSPSEKDTGEAVAGIFRSKNIRAQVLHLEPCLTGTCIL